VNEIRYSRLVPTTPRRSRPRSRRDAWSGSRTPPFGRRKPILYSGLRPRRVAVPRRPGHPHRRGHQPDTRRRL